MFYTLRNVNKAFKALVGMIYNEIIPTQSASSRAGDVIYISHPVMVTYEKPNECVLFNKARDCNPFFHLFESLWMLAGRNDVKPLGYYSSKIGEIASDDGKTFNGAYGYRWRYGEKGLYGDVDQLTTIVDHLKNKPNSRRAVLQMWNVEDDLVNIDKSKDVCCNLCVCFLINRHALDMTVYNRSNDLVLGMLGANVVHFSFLQRYVADSLGVRSGKYTQVTNNLHVYTKNWKPIDWLLDNTPVPYDEPLRERIPKDWVHYPLVNEQLRFDAEVKEFVDNPEGVFKEAFLKNVAAPMCLAFRHYKEEDLDRALEAVEMVRAADWRVAGRNWLVKRKERRDARRTGTNQEGLCTEV